MEPEDQVVILEEEEPRSIIVNIRQKIRNSFRKEVEKPQREELLQGKALQVYWFLLTHPQGLAGIREIQKALDISSSGSVSYQINKLISLGIVAKNDNTEKYYVKEEVKSGILGFYFRLGYHVIPRFSIYLIIFIIGLLSYLLFSMLRGDAYILDPSNWLFLFFLLFGIAIFVYESRKIGRMKPE